MRKSVVETAALAATLLVAGLALAQTAPPPAPQEPPANKNAPEKSKLEEMLAKALRDNPDVRLAAAKLAESEAELNKARLSVVQKVASHYQSVEAQKAAVAAAEAELEETKTAYKAATLPQTAVRAAEQKLIDSKAKLAQLEAELPYLLGQPAEGKNDATLRFWFDDWAVGRGDAAQDYDKFRANYIRRFYLDVYGRLPTPEELASGAPPKAAVQGPTADRIRAALDKPFTQEIKERRIGVVITALKDAFEKDNPGLLFNVNGIVKLENVEAEMGVPAFRFDHVPFGAALEWVEDSLPECRIVVRDYGIAIVPKDALPPGAPLLHDFWKGAKAEHKNPQPGAKDQPANSPAKNVEGVVKDVEKDGRLHINLIGKSDGLAKGDMLMVIRQESAVGRALLVGDVRVVEVKDGEAVAQPVEPLHTPAKPGDKVRGSGK